MTVAYSYIRFSTPAQQEGDSLRRQLRKSERYAEKSGLVLDSSTRDLGLSAFKGAHRHKGALKAFLNRVEQGEIAPGSFLLVENLDRLTREDVLEAVALFLNIISANITVVTFSDNMVYNRELIIDHPEYLNISISQFIRGNAESRRKAELLGDTWADKRRDLVANSRKVLTKQGPSWLTFVADDAAQPLVGHWVENERAEVVRSIFGMCLNGLGKERIASKLIDQGVDSFKNGDGWQASTVYYLLKDRRMLGEFQTMTKVGGLRRPVGDPLPNYFPRVIDETTFYAVQSELARRNTGAGQGRNGKSVNLFIGLVRCASCGRTMEYRDKRGKRNKLPSNVYLMCSGRRRSDRLCENGSRWTYSTTENMVLDFVTDIVVPEDDNAHLAAAKLLGATAKREDLKRRLERTLEDRENETDADFRAHFMTRARALKSELATVDEEIAGLTLTTEQAKRDVIDMRREAVAKVREELTVEPDNFELRSKLAVALRQVIDHVEFEENGSFTAFLHGGSKAYRFADGKFSHVVDLGSVNTWVKFPTAQQKRDANWFIKQPA